MNDKPLIIDGQLLQTNAWHRGMGKYSISLIQGILEENRQVVIILNKNLPMDKERNKVLSSFLSEKVTIVELDLPHHCDIVKGRKKARRVFDEYLDKNYKNSEFNFLILSVFTFDYVASFPTRGFKTSILYDLIPLLYWDEFKKLFQASAYFEHFKTLYEADKLFCISESVRDDAERVLSIDNTKLVNIAGAFIAREMEDTTEREDYLIKELLKERFILFPSADLPHKNNETTIKAFETFNQVFGGKFKLVITSNYSDKSKLFLSALSPSVIFTGPINDTAFQHLLHKTEFVVFNSLTEGLGLPILEAVHENKPVVCSGIKVHKEISESAFYFCSPTSEDSIIEALMDAIQKKYWEGKKSQYKEIKERYTWANSAKILLDNLTSSSTSIPGKKSLFVFSSAYLDSMKAVERSSAIVELQKNFEVTTIETNRQNNSAFFASFVTKSTRLRKLKNTPGRLNVHFIDYENPTSVFMALQFGGISIIDCDTDDIVKRLISDGYIETGRISGENASKELMNLLSQNNKIIAIGNKTGKESKISRVKSLSEAIDLVKTWDN